MLTLQDFPETINLINRLQELNKTAKLVTTVLDVSAEKLKLKLEMIDNYHLTWVIDLEKATKKDDILVADTSTNTKFCTVDWRKTRKLLDILAECCKLLNTTPENLVAKIKQIVEQNEKLKLEIESLEK